VPWKERKIVGTLEFPNGKTCALREGDLPNRNPYVPDDLMMPEDRVKQLPKYTTDRLNRTTGIDLRQYDVAERDILFNDARGASAFGISDTLTTSAPGAAAAHEDMQMEMVVGGGKGGGGGAAGGVKGRGGVGLWVGKL